MQGTDQLETRHIFIDTSIFIAANFHYQSSTFRQLVALASESYLFVHLTPVTVGEVKANIRERVEAAHRAVQKCKKEAMVLRHLPGDTYKGLFVDFAAGDVERSLVQKFETFVSESRADVISLNGAPVDRVFSQYFSSSPPFGSGQKKSEFPDAFALAALSEWCATKGKKIYVISKDGDMERVCEGNESLVFLDSLEKLLNLVATDDKILAAFAESVFERLEPDITKGIIEQFGWLGFMVDDEDGEVDNTEVKAVNIDEHYLIHVTDSDVSFRLEVSVDYSADVTYYDPDSGVYDKEEGVMLYRETVDETLDRTVELSVDVQISFDRLGDLWSARLDDVSFDASDVYVSIYEEQDYK